MIADDFLQRCRKSSAIMCDSGAEEKFGDYLSE